MNITKLDAAKSQLATAIWLYFEDCDPVSVHTLVMAAAEIIDRLCESKGTPTWRCSFSTMIIPEWRKEFVRRFYKARNFFKHASVLENFSDELNLVSIFMAAQGLLLLGVELLEVRMFRRRVMVVEPEMVEVYTSCGIAHNLLFDDLRDQPRAVQKERGRDAPRASGG
jgi:hypothetical protein